MYRKAEREFGVNGVTTQTHQITQNNKPMLSDEDKMILALVNKHPPMSQRKNTRKQWSLDGL